MNKLLFISLALFSLNTVAQQSTTCDVAQVNAVTAGPNFSTLVRVNNAACGNAGWVCIAPRNETRLEEIFSDRIFSLAVTARATQANVRIVHAENNSSVCPPQFPDILDFRLLL